MSQSTSSQTITKIQTMIPLNNYVQIEPQVKEDFISSSTESYNEIGKVIALPNQVAIDGKRYFSEDLSLKVGDRVYFDSWMASKYPDGRGGFYWLVPFDNIKAYEPISKEPMQGDLPSQVQDTTITQSGIVGTM